MLTEHAEQAARALGLEYTLEKVTDIHAIVTFGVVASPALVVDGEIEVACRVPTAEAVEPLLARLVPPDMRRVTEELGRYSSAGCIDSA